MDTQALRLMVTAEVQKAISELDKLKGAAEGAEVQSNKLTDALSAAAFAAGVAVIKKGVDAFVAQENALVKLNAVYKATGGVVGLSVNELEDFATELESTTGLADDAAMEMQSLLLTFKNIQGDGFKETARLAVDLAAVMGGDVRGAAMQLGKALEDPINGLSALRRSGVSFSEAQQDTIKALVETNRLAEAQAMILKAVDGQVGGTAQALQNTLGGSLTAAANAFDNLLEVVGEGFAPTVKTLADIVNGVSTALQSVNPAALAAGTAFVTAAAGVNALAAGAVALGIKLPMAFGPVGIAVAGVTAGVIALIGYLEEVKKQSEEVARIPVNSDLRGAARAELEAMEAARRARGGGTARERTPEEIAAEEARLKAIEEQNRRMLDQEKIMVRVNRERQAALMLSQEALSSEDLVPEIGKILDPLEELRQAYAELDADMTDLAQKDPFEAMAQGAQSALTVLGQWQPALTAFGNLYSEVSRQIQEENAAILKGMETAMQMDQLRYTNQIRNAQAAGQSTIALEQAAADAAYKAQEELDAKRAELEKKAFEREKLARMASIAMNTAVAVTQALATPGGIALAALVGGMGAAQLAIASQQQYPGLANGGTVTSPGMTMVGERGPELLSLPRGAQVTPLGKAGVTVIIQGGTFIGAGGLDEAVIAIKKRMDQLQRTGVLA